MQQSEATLRGACAIAAMQEVQIPRSEGEAVCREYAEGKQGVLRWWKKRQARGEEVGAVSRGEQVVYHGTRSPADTDIGQLTTRKSPSGMIWFTTSADQATAYTNPENGWWIDEMIDHSSTVRLVPARIRLNKPANLSAFDVNEDIRLETLLRTIGISDARATADRINDYQLAKEMWVWWHTNPDFTPVLKEKGFDGLIVGDGLGTDALTLTFAVFDDAQVEGCPNWWKRLKKYTHHNIAAI